MSWPRATLTPPEWGYRAGTVVCRCIYVPLMVWSLQKEAQRIFNLQKLRDGLTSSKRIQCALPALSQLSKIVTPFPVFEEHWDPNAVITLVDDQGGTLDVKLLELLCFTLTVYALQSQSQRSTQDGERWVGRKPRKGVLNHLKKT